MPRPSTSRPPLNAGFTLLELAIVVLVLGLLAAAAFRYATQASNTANYTTLNTTMDTVETALQDYLNTFSRLPCPSDITLAESNASFGVEVGTSGDGNCTGYNFINSGTDPDNADGLYDSATASKVVAGGVPTKTLHIEDKYAYDPWGHKILFAIDKRFTVSNATTTYNVSNSTIGAIAIKTATTDTLANALTYKGVYALVSFGPNGHGGYVRNPATTSTTRFNAGSTNSNELKNCHCDNTAAATAFDRIFIQNSRSATTTLTNAFDDVVRYKTRAQLATYSELQ